MGRPEKPIDWDQVEKYIEAKCTAKEIAGRFAMHIDTFCDRFRAHYEENFTDYTVKKQGAGEALIKLSQLNAACKGNTQMLTLLGKLWLGQKDTNDDIPPLDSKVDQENEEMSEKALLRKQLAELQAKIDHLTQARPELSGIDPSL